MSFFTTCYLLFYCYLEIRIIWWPTSQTFDSEKVDCGRFTRKPVRPLPISLVSSAPFFGGALHDIPPPPRKQTAAAETTVGPDNKLRGQWIKEREINMSCVILFRYTHNVVFFAVTLRRNFKPIFLWTVSPGERTFNAGDLTSGETTSYRKSWWV